MNSNLSEVLKENIGRSSYEMRQFFQGKITDGELKAYSIDFNRKKIMKDNENEKIIRIRKGATLTPLEKLSEYRPALLEDPKTGTRYKLDIGTRGGMFFNDGDSQTIYHQCVLEKLVNGFDFRKVFTKNYFNGILIPGDMISAKLFVAYNEDWESSGESDYISGKSGSLVVEGEMDALFEKVCEFVRGRSK